MEERLSKSENKVYAAVKENRITGYVVFRFKSAETQSIFVNDIFVSELLYDSEEAFSQLMTFLNSQKDQIRYILMNTFEEDFRFILQDLRSHTHHMLDLVIHEYCTRGTGLMYRIINVKKLFEDLKMHNFNGVSCKLRLSVSDSLIEDNNGEFILHFVQGKLHEVNNKANNEACDVTLSIGISELSSLITCAVNLKFLYRYGLARLSDGAYLSLLDTLFSSDEKPVCFTAF